VDLARSPREHRRGAQINHEHTAQRLALSAKRRHRQPSSRKRNSISARLRRRKVKPERAGRGQMAQPVEVGGGGHLPKSYLATGLSLEVWGNSPL
jgi:hypothetical protein